MHGRPKRSPEKVSVFLDALREGEPVGVACKLAGFARRSVYEWRAADPVFKADWEQAYEDGTDTLESIVRQRAADGSDLLAMFLLKSRNRTRFADNSRVELTGANGGPIQHETRALDAVESRLAELASRRDEAESPKRAH